MNKKEKDEAREAQDLNEEFSENTSDSRSIGEDFELSKLKNYPSDAMPQDLFQYKKMRIIPDSSADFQGLLDKDWVMANMGGSKPDLQQKKFEVGTFNLVRSVFVSEVLIELRDKSGSVLQDDEGNAVFIKKETFDPQFEPVLNFLLGDIKSELVGSRALGDRSREAVLDVTTNISKAVEKQTADKSKRYGLG